MGINLTQNINISKSCGCNKCFNSDSLTEKNQDINNPQNENICIMNNKNIIEENDKKNILFQEQNDKIYDKNKLKKIFIEKHLSSITNSSKQDLQTLKTIKIQSYFRGFLCRKQFLQQIIFNKLNNIKKNKEKDSEEDNIDIENNLVISFSMNGTIFTGDNSCKSSISIKTKIKNNSTNKELSKFLINKNILSFNLKSKNNIKYKYFGFIKLKNNNKLSYISTSGIVKNSNINDTKVKNGFGKLIFEDNSIFECNFDDNKANGIGKYIDKNNNEEYAGEYKNNIPNGYGIYSNILNQRKCMGYFKINGINDIGIEESIEDGYKYYGEFENNQKNGVGILQWKEGIKYEGYFFRNQMNGYAIIKYPHKKIYKGQIKNGKMEGFGEFNWGGENKYLGYYNNDKRNGFGIFLWNINTIKKGNTLNNLNNIKVYIGFWNDGNMNGVGLKINDGKIKYGIWKNGIKSGWIEKKENIKNYIQNHQKKYLKIILGKKQTIIDLLNICLFSDDNENSNYEEEFELY